jgi:hypothetical protein
MKELSNLDQKILLGIVSRAPNILNDINTKDGSADCSAESSSDSDFSPNPEEKTKIYPKKSKYDIDSKK